MSLIWPAKKRKAKNHNSHTTDLNWQVFRIMAEFVEGFQFLSDLEREVTFFGSARIHHQDRYYREARQLARKLGEHGFTIITGGGPGIMEAANRGAFEAGAPSIGLNIQLPFEQRTNKYVTRGIGFYFFFSRKVMLSTSAQAYIFFPGGFGTLDELFSVLTLIQTEKMLTVPVILYGADYWQPLINWMKKNMFQKHQAIHASDLGLFQLVDTPDQAFKIIKKTKDSRLFNQFM